jgi:release factor glutamine methyltransferase
MTEDELILTHILNCSRSELYLQKPKLSIEQQKQFDSYKARRSQGEPLQYILGTCNFFDLEFNVDSRVLIPRPETEILVDHAIKMMTDLPASILDLGTGSGNISITLAKFLPEAKIKSIDISEGALEVAQDNALRHAVNDKINFLCADMVEYLSAAASYPNPIQFDLIISNPPYVPEGQMDSLPKDVQQEPEQALKAGKDGLKFYRDIIKYTPSLIRAGGYLMMEFGDGQGLAIKDLLKQQLAFSQIEILQDLTGRDRIICIQKF